MRKYLPPFLLRYIKRGNNRVLNSFRLSRSRQTENHPIAAILRRKSLHNNRRIAHVLFMNVLENIIRLSDNFRQITQRTPVLHHSATLPSSCLQTGFLQRCGV